MEYQRVATIGSNNMVTWAISDPSGRDNADRWISATLQQTGGAQMSENRSFDGAGRLASQSGAGYTSGNSASYAYDSGPGGINTTGTGLLDYASLPLLLGGTVTEGTSSSPITYDANQRISTATVNGVAGSYTFDGAGNLKTDTEGATTTNFTYNPANQLTQSVTGSNTTVYGWDTTNAWRTSQGPSGTPNQIQYAYNAQGRMRSYANSATGVSATYTYDATGQRTQSAVTVGGVTTTTSWVYDGLTLMSQQVLQGSNSWRIDYLYNEDGTPIGGVYRSPANSTSPVFFAMITNSHGDVCELLDANGNAFGAYHYDAWGLPQGSGSYATGIWMQSTSLISSTLAGQIASEQALRYASYVYDPESGLYYCSARYYDPATRQWTTADSAKADGEESAYQYCGGDPVSGVDPTGEEVTGGGGTSWTARSMFWSFVGKREGKSRALLQFTAHWTTDRKNVNYIITEFAHREDGWYGIHYRGLSTYGRYYSAGGNSHATYSVSLEATYAYSPSQGAAGDTDYFDQRVIVHVAATRVYAGYDGLATLENHNTDGFSWSEGYW